MSTGEKLPLKKVAIRQTDYFRPEGGGSARKVFGPVTPEVRRRLGDEVQTTEAHFKGTFESNPKAAAVARVALKEEALAKSHRPTQLFKSADCPIVGIGQMGELLVSVRQATLPRLARAISLDATKQAVANISTIHRIEPFQLSDEQISAVAKVVKKDKEIALKLRIFRHGDGTADAALAGALEKTLKDLQIAARRLDVYGESMTVFRLDNVRPEHVAKLGRFVGTQSLGAFPTYHVVRPAAQPVGKLSAMQFPPPDPNTEYPVVGIIDSGVDPSNALLTPWIVARETYVPAANRDYEHGTFVAGLLVHARLLNHDDTRFPRCPCRVVDVVAFPKNGIISEDELLAVLWEVVPKYPSVRVWNLSLTGSIPCSDHAFSDLAVALDEIQSKHGVTFVLAAGNYNKPPFRDWPVAERSPGDDDRICGPADSVRALTVGSVAHRDSPRARVRAGEPSPFGRRGPGPVYLPKPEVTHFGGNCDQHGAHAQIGVLSADGRGNLAESIGTSFASPITAAVLAHVQHRPVEKLSNLMAKALLVHSAVLGNGRLPAGELDYRGFGMPADAAEVLGCEPWRATLLFELDLRSGVDLHRAPFPLPACLFLNRTLRAEMTVTLAYEPPLDATFGAEYCRTNVDVSLGSYDPDDRGARAQKRQIHPFPERFDTSTFERGLIEQGFKWSPMKVYRRAMPRGVTADTWRLALSATDRSGALNTPVRVAVVVTVADIEQQAPVYNDIVKAMNQLGWAASDVRVRGRIRAA